MTAKRSKHLRNIQDSTFADTDFSDFSIFIFKIPVEKVVKDKKELHGIEIQEQCLSIKNVGI